MPRHPPSDSEDTPLYALAGSIPSAVDSVSSFCWNRETSCSHQEIQRKHAPPCSAGWGAWDHVRYGRAQPEPSEIDRLGWGLLLYERVHFRKHDAHEDEHDPEQDEGRDLFAKHKEPSQHGSRKLG